MPSDRTPEPGPDEREIEKMLEEARMKPVPADVLKGFKDDVMRRIEADRAAARPKPGRWFASGFKLPVGLSIGAGALACLLIASLSVLVMEKPRPAQVASIPAVMTQAVPAPAAVFRKAPLTVEEELRLIEEFDDRRFFIRQDITDDDLASA